MTLKIGIICLGLVCLLGIGLLGRALNQAQSEVLFLHEKFRLWDIAEMAAKCNKFLMKRGKPVKTQRHSSILKIFPATTYLDILEHSKKSKKTEKGLLASKEDEEEESLAETEEDKKFKVKDSCVTIDWKEDYCKVIIILSLTVLAVSFVLGFSIFLQYSSAEKLTSKF